MCRRDTDDPLAKFFFQRFQMHFLALPRENADVGDCYVLTPKGILDPGPIKKLLSAEFRMPRVTRNEGLAEVASTVSKSVGIDVGFTLLGPFLTALGAGLLVKDIKAGLAAKGTRELSFQLRNATRDHVSPPDIGGALIGMAFNSAHPLVRSENRYFVTTGVVRTLSLTVHATDSAKTKVDVSAATIAGSGKAGVEVKSAEKGELTVRGEKPLAIAVELHEIGYDYENGKFLVEPLERLQKVRTGSRAPVALPTEIANEAFLNVQEWRR